MKELNFRMILDNLEKVAKEAAEAENFDERRKILPTELEQKYFEKLVKKLKTLRRELTEEERRLAKRVAKLEKQALVAYYKGLDSIR